MRNRTGFSLSYWGLLFILLISAQNGRAEGPNAPAVSPITSTTSSLIPSSAAISNATTNNPIYPSVGLPNSDLAPITNTGVTDPVNDFIRRMFITIGASTINNPGAIIDKIVGDPWQLNPSTAEKLERFDARLRLQIDSVFAANSGAFLGAHSVPVPGDNATAQGLPVMLVDAKAAKPVLTDVANRMTNYFTPEELIDLGVYYLSKQSFFPKNPAAWNDVKDDIVRNAVPLALAVLAVGAVSNQGALSVDGKIFKVKDSDFRLGWYSSVRNLGINLDPSLRAGLNARTSKFESTAGMVYDVNAAPGTEQAGVELSFREHVLAPLVKPSGWDIGFFTGGHYSILNGNPVEQGKFRQELDFYAKKEHFVNSPNLEAIGSAAFSTDYKTQTSTRVNLGFDDPRYDLAGGFSATRSTDTQSAIGNSYNVGIFFGGSLDSKIDIAKNGMNQGRRRVEDRLETVKRELHRQTELANLLNLLQTAGSPDQITENDLNRKILLQQAQLIEAKRDLATVLREYLQYRNKYFVLSGSVKSRDQITDDYGPLPAETLEEVRKALGDQPRYRSAADATGQNPSAPVPAQAVGAPGALATKPENGPAVGAPAPPIAAGAASTWGNH